MRNQRLDSPNVALNINQVRSDDQLVRGSVDDADGPEAILNLLELQVTDKARSRPPGNDGKREPGRGPRPLPSQP